MKQLDINQSTPPIVVSLLFLIERRRHLYPRHLNMTRSIRLRTESASAAETLYPIIGGVRSHGATSVLRCKVRD